MSGSDQIMRLQALPLFTSPEAAALRIGLLDPLSSVRSETRWVRRLRSLLGFARPNRLADGRLEAIRRFAVVLRDAGALSPAQIDAIAAAAAPANRDRIV